MHEHEKALDYITALNQLLDEWKVTVLFPNDSVRILCFKMGEEELDTRMIREPTDRTHLAYAMAYHSDYFLTSDRNLIRYRIPSSLEEIGFSKPTCLPLEEFRNDMFMKVRDVSYAWDHRYILESQRCEVNHPDECPEFMQSLKPRPSGRGS
ncbi:hypothetical protein [Methanocalculus sp.]|uniref:hypothetical protein n=1 Tax=Methanocalculus sp. TaxID=2004547 RepID=UPI003183990D